MIKRFHTPALDAQKRKDNAFRSGIHRPSGDPRQCTEAVAFAPAKLSQFLLLADAIEESLYRVQPATGTRIVPLSTCTHEFVKLSQQ